MPVRKPVKKPDDHSTKIRKNGWVLLGLGMFYSTIFGLMQTLLKSISFIDQQGKMVQQVNIKMSGYEFGVPAVFMILGALMVSNEFFIEVVKAWRKK